MPQIAVVATIAAAAMSAAGSIMSGNAARSEAKFEAGQMRQQAGQERAVSQRQAMEQRRQAGLVNSTVQARAAASGASATDPTVLNIEADNAGAGEYNALSALYTGEEKARGLEMGASARQYEGDNARKASLLKAGSTIMGGANSLYQSGAADSLFTKYGNDGPGIPSNAMSYNTGPGPLPWLKENQLPWANYG